MANSNDVKITISAESKDAEKVLKKLSKAMEDVGDSANKSKKPLEEFGSKIGDLASKAKFAGVVVAAAKTTAALMEFSASCVKASMETTKLKSSLEVLTGSAEKGQRVYKEFADFAAETPFDTVGVVNYGKQMIAMGYDVNEVTKYLRIFGDTASATGSDLGSIVLVMGQIRNATSLQLQDINQLQNAGVNVWQMLAKESGKSIEEMKEAVHKGTVTGAQAFEMLSKQMQATFGGMMDKQADTLEGAINELGETVDNTKAKFGEWLSVALDLKEGIKKVTMGLKDMVGATEENRKADTNLANVQAQVQKNIEDTQYVLEDLEDQMHRGIITTDEYRQKEAAIREGCEIAQNGIANVNSAVGDLNGMMQQGIITAHDYANALASIANAQARMGAIGQQMQQAILDGNQEAVTDLKVQMASVAAEVGYELKNAKDIGAHYALYGKDGSGTIKTGGGGGGAVATTGSSGGAGSTPKDNSASEGYQKLQTKWSTEINKQKELNDLKLKSAEITQQMHNIGLSGLDLEKQQGLDKLNNLQAQRVAEKEIADAKKEAYEKQIAYLQENPFDGSQKILENLELQKNAEAEIAKARLANMDLMIQAQKKLNEFNNENHLTTVKQQWQNYAKSISASMGQAVASVINGQQSMGQALKQMAQQMISNALQMLAQWVVLVAILAAFQDPTPAKHASQMMFGDGIGKGKAQKNAQGGYISGAGTGTSDSILSYLSNGEYVMTAEATRRLGVPFLNGLNSGRLSGFATGGLVGSAGIHSQESGAVRSNTSSVTLNISAMDASGFGDFLAKGGLDSIKQALFDDNRMFAGEVGVW